MKTVGLVVKKAPAKDANKDKKAPAKDDANAVKRG